MAELTVPRVDFSTLGELPTVYRAAQRDAARQQTLADLGNSAGGLDYMTAAKRLLAAGDVQGATTLAQLGTNERDFAFRQDESRRAQSNADRSYGLQEKTTNATLEGNKVPAGFERDPASGGLRPVKGGPQDPEYLRESRKGPQMSVGDITKLSEEGGKFANIGGFIDTFKPDFAGKPFGTGEASNYLARNLPSSLTGEQQRDAAGWWQGYDRYKNVVRNDLFGSALTVNEQAAFEKADINPGMNPELVQRNLKIQRDIIANGVKRKAGALIQSGQDPEVVSKAYGIDLATLGITPKKPAAAAAQPGQQAPQQQQQFRDGQRARNPQTGATIEFRNGEWAPVE